MKYLVFYICLFFGFNVTHAQIQGGAGYFSYPMSIKPKLNANFGEMRPNHFHMGLDLSTESRENVPVYAPAEGYIGRIKIEQGGFGRAIYINHPNGLTTLYAHMNRFIPAAEQYLRQKQHEQETWKIDLSVPENIIPVKKGQLIGYSGNTGASQGPHLHYEIRDTKTENCLNPLRMQFPISDQIPPTLMRLVFYDRSKSIYEQSPIPVPLIKVGNKYKTAGIIKLPYEHTFIGLLAIDRINGAANQYGVYKAALLKKDELITSFEMENIGYDKTRYLNGHIDYVTRTKGGPYYQMLFPPLGFGLDIYSPKPTTNSITLTESPEEYTMNVYDADGNISTATFQVQGTSIKSPETIREGIKMTPGTVNIIEDDAVRIVFNEDAFYDSFHFNYKTFYAVGNDLVSSVIQTLPEYIPVQSNFTISIKPNRSEVLMNPDKILMKRTYRGKTDLKKAKKEKDFYSAQFRDFGNFQLIEDLQPPVIAANIFSGKLVAGNTRIVVDVSDNNKFIKDFRASIDGQWVMFQPSGNRFVYYPDEYFPPGEHKLLIVVYDEAGNMASKEWILKR